MRTKTHDELIRDILAPNLSLVFRILSECIICVFVSSSFSFRDLSNITLTPKLKLALGCSSCRDHAKMFFNSRKLFLVTH